MAHLEELSCWAVRESSHLGSKRLHVENHHMSAPLLLSAAVRAAHGSADCREKFRSFAVAVSDTLYYDKDIQLQYCWFHGGRRLLRLLRHGSDVIHGYRET